MENMLPLFVVIPLGAAFVIPVLGLFRLEKAWDIVAVAATLAVLTLSITMLTGESVVVTWIGGYVGTRDVGSLTGIPLVSDGLSRLILLVVNGIAAAATIYSMSYIKRYTKTYLYYVLLLLMVAGMNGIALSGDLFNIYVFVEITAIASFALVGYTLKSEALEATFKYLVLSGIATSFVLLGIALVYKQTGTLNLAQIGGLLEGKEIGKPLWLAFGLILGGFSLKAAMVPFHAWLPDAHPSAPAPISAMLSGVMIKASGVYVLARIAFNVLGASYASGVLFMALGSLSMLIGVLLAVGQWDFKRLLAYHSISQMGYVVLSLGVGLEMMAQGSPTIGYVAVFGGLFHLMNHALFKSLLFLCSGSAVHRTGSRMLKKIQGIAGRMPVTGLCTRIASLSISGVPPFNGFFSKLLITIAVVWAGHWALGLVTIVASFLTLVSFTKVQRYLVEGELAEEYETIEESPYPMVVPMVVLAVLCATVGVLVPVYKDVLLGPASDVLVGGFNYTNAIFGG